MSDHPELEFTGERFTPECVREIAYEHWHRYAWASRLVTGMQVLDAACGEGYGTRLLARTAGSVVGVDIDPGAIEHARRRYAGPATRFECADCTRLPLDDDSVDAVVSFETLEHLEAQDRLLAEFRRVLRPRVSCCCRRRIARPTAMRPVTPTRSMCASSTAMNSSPCWAGTFPPGGCSGRS